MLKINSLERKLASKVEVEGLVVVYSATYTLIDHIAKFRVQMTRPQLGRRGQLGTEEAEIAIATAGLSPSVQ